MLWVTTRGKCLHGIEGLMGEGSNETEEEILAIEYYEYPITMGISQGSVKEAEPRTCVYIRICRCVRAYILYITYYIHIICHVIYYILHILHCILCYIIKYYIIYHALHEFCVIDKDLTLCNCGTCGPRAWRWNLISTGQAVRKNRWL